MRIPDGSASGVVSTKLIILVPELVLQLRVAFLFSGPTQSPRDDIIVAFRRRFPGHLPVSRHAPRKIPGFSGAGGSATPSTGRVLDCAGSRRSGRRGHAHFAWLETQPRSRFRWGAAELLRQGCFIRGLSNTVISCALPPGRTRCEHQHGQHAYCCELQSQTHRVPGLTVACRRRPGRTHRSQACWRL